MILRKSVNSLTPAEKKACVDAPLALKKNGRSMSHWLCIATAMLLVVGSHSICWMSLTKADEFDVWAEASQWKHADRSSGKAEPGKDRPGRIHIKATKGDILYFQMRGPHDEFLFENGTDERTNAWTAIVPPSGVPVPELKVLPEDDPRRNVYIHPDKVLTARRSSPLSPIIIAIEINELTTDRPILFACGNTSHKDSRMFGAITLETRSPADTDVTKPAAADFKVDLPPGLRIVQLASPTPESAKAKAAAADALIDVLLSESAGGYVRDRAALALVVMSNDSIIPVKDRLETLLKACAEGNKCFGNVQRLVDVLGSIGLPVASNEEAVGALLRVVVSTFSKGGIKEIRDTRIAAINALADIFDPESKKPTDTSDESKLKYEQVVPAITSCARDASTHLAVKLAAVQALGRILGTERSDSGSY